MCLFMGTATDTNVLRKDIIQIHVYDLRHLREIKVSQINSHFKSELFFYTFSLDFELIYFILKALVGQ